VTEHDQTLALEVRLAELGARVEQLTSELADLSAAGPAMDGPGRVYGVPEPAYDSLDEWVAEYFAPTFARSIGGDLRWCASWTDHAEALTRLEALWRAWEALRLDPTTGMVTWLTSYLDPQLAALLSRSGTFAQCSPDRHSATAALPLSRVEFGVT
jgi:hypothetical protein